MDIGSIQSFIMEAVASNQFFQGGAVLGILAVVGNYAKNGFLWVYYRLIRLISYEIVIPQKDKLYLFTEVYLANNYGNKFKKVEARFEVNKSNAFVRVVDSGDPTGMDKTQLSLSPLNDMLFIWKGFRHLTITCDRQKLEAASSSWNSHLYEIRIKGLFAKKAITKLMDEVQSQGFEWLTEMKNKSVEINVWSQNSWCTNSYKSPKDVKDLFFDDKKLLVDDLLSFIRSKEWYSDRSLRYSRGILLYGPPGNGKTSLVHSLGKLLGKSVNIINLNNLSDESLIDAMGNLSPGSILAFEDVDAAFNKREASKEMLSFSTLLNCIDGTYSKEDVITIFTTNHKEKLDPALLRAGRVDIEIHLPNPSKKLVQDYVHNFYKEEVPDFEYNKEFSMSKIQNICLTHKHDMLKAIEQLKN